jgi:hypothetical protein
MVKLQLQFWDGIPAMAYDEAVIITKKLPEVGNIQILTLYQIWQDPSNSDKLEISYYRHSFLFVILDSYTFFKLTNIHFLIYFIFY